MSKGRIRREQGKGGSKEREKSRRKWKGRELGQGRKKGGREREQASGGKGRGSVD